MGKKEEREAGDEVGAVGGDPQPQVRLRERSPPPPGPVWTPTDRRSKRSPSTRSQARHLFTYQTGTQVSLRILHLYSSLPSPAC